MKYSLSQILALLLTACVAHSTPATSIIKSKTDCIILSAELKDHQSLKDSPIETPGKYCLPVDVTAYRWDGADRGGLLIAQASDIEFDLQGHLLYGKSRGQQIISQRLTKQYPLIQHNTVRNGILKSYSVEGVMLDGGVQLNTDLKGGNNFYASDLMGFVSLGKQRESNDIYLRAAREKLDNFNENLAKIRDNFPLTENTIDNVKVSAENIGVGIKGGGNIIRNSIIQIGENNVNWGTKTPKQLDAENEGKPTSQVRSWGGGTASLYLFGPNQLIENNIIIFKGKTRTSRSSAAPIKIHAADGTIIRNNTIIIESSGEDIPQTAISIFDSKNVVIENNKIFGTKSVYKIWDEEDKGSSVKETGTTFPPFWKKPKSSF